MRRKKRTRKLVKGITTICILLICIGATAAVTWALLTATSTEKENVFKGTSGLSVEAKEPNWDSTGKTKAENYSPNLEIPKDPYLENTTEIKTGHENDSKEYVAIRLTYQINRVNPGTEGDPEWETISYASFQKLADVYYDNSGVNTLGFNLAASDTDIDTEKWIAADNEKKIFYYNTVLAGKTDPGTDDETSKLFDVVKIDTNLTESSLFKCDNAGHYTETTGTLTASNHKGLIGFRIVVEGFAVQAYEDGALVPFDTAKTRLKALIDENPAPTDTP